MAEDGQTPRRANGYEIDGILVEPRRFLPDDNVLVTHTHYDHGVKRLPDRMDSWQVLETPGHATEHVCLYDGQTLIAGDVVEGPGGSLPVVPVIGGDMAAMMRTLESLLALPILTVLPGHGEPVRGRSWCSTLIAAQLTERRKREQEVFQSVRQSIDGTIEDIVAQRSNRPRSVRGKELFEGETLMILRKLAAEGRITHTLYRWRPCR